MVSISGVSEYRLCVSGPLKPSTISIQSDQRREREEMKRRHRISILQIHTLPDRIKRVGEIGRHRRAEVAQYEDRLRGRNDWRKAQVRKGQHSEQ